MRPLRCLPILAGCLLLLPTAGASEITGQGKKLARALDEMPVKHRWLRGYIVEWESGKSIRKATDGRPHTHCSAFAASAAKRLGIYLLRPKGPDDPADVKGHPTKRLANAQFDWLQGDQAKKLGWHEVHGPVEAQHKANQGYLVVASFKEENAKKPGHIAIVRPSTRSEKSVETDGPEIMQAGMTNVVATTLREGFEHHPHAWQTGRKVRFFYNTQTPKFP